jgi:hypothetical protein
MVIYDCHTAERVKLFVVYKRRGGQKVKNKERQKDEINHLKLTK